MNVDPVFTTAEMDRIFSATTRLQQFGRFEAALARAQATAGIIPEAAAEAIAAVCAEPVPDPEKMLRDGWEVGTPVQVLVEHLRRSLPAEHAGHLHQGATTQDVVDTAAILQCAAALETIDRGLATAESVAVLANRHRRSPTRARTLLQPARPTTHGARFAGWLAATTDARGDIRRTRQRLPVQLGGPVGDTAPFGTSWTELVAHMAEDLGLAVPEAPWHTYRRPIEEVAAVAGRVAGLASKIASDVALLTATEEITVRAGGSSSMADKRNPIDAIRAKAAAEVCRVAVAGLVSAPAHELERGMGPWHAEWALLPLVFSAAGAAVEAIGRCVGSLEVVEIDETGEEPPGLIDRALGMWRREDT